LKVKNIYSPNVLRMFRFFATLGIIAEFFYLSRLLNTMSYHFSWPATHTLDAFLASNEGLFAANSICLIIFIVLLFVPQCIELVAVIAFYFSFTYLITPALGKKPLGTLLYLLGVSSLVLRGMYRKHTKAKVLTTITIYILLTISDIRFGLPQMLDSIIDSLGLLLAYAVSMVFFVHFLRSMHMNKIQKVLDLSQYPELTDRDKQWIRAILKDTKYEDIAKESGITIGTLKNRMHQIFTIIGVADRVGLLATYGGYEIKD